MQFSLKHLFGWTAAVAVLCGVLFGLPEPFGMVVLGMSLMSSPIVLVVGTIYSREWTRTFFIGSLMAFAPILVPILLYVPVYAVVALTGELDPGDLAAIDFSTLLSIKLALLAPWMIACCGGVVAVATRWLVEPAAARVKPAPTPLAPVSEPVVSPYVVIEDRMKAAV